MVNNTLLVLLCERAKTALVALFLGLYCRSKIIVLVHLGSLPCLQAGVHWHNIAVADKICRAADEPASKAKYADKSPLDDSPVAPNWYRSDRLALDVLL